jgi:osmoprotectant transport system permease protein
MMEIEPILNATLDHLKLVYGSLAFGIILSFPLAIIAFYRRNFTSWIIGFANLVQAVPSFAVVALVVPLLGIGFEPAVLAIVIRALLPIIKNTVIGLDSVDPFSIESAKGIGLTEWQVIRHIRFPNAYPAIFAGLKFAAILANSIAANSIAVLTAIIGSGGLGSLVFEGLAQNNIDKIAAGAVPAIILAILIDVSFTLTERKLTPLALRR